MLSAPPLVFTPAACCKKPELGLRSKQKTAHRKKRRMDRRCACRFPGVRFGLRPAEPSASLANDIATGCARRSVRLFFVSSVPADGKMRRLQSRTTGKDAL